MEKVNSVQEFVSWLITFTSLFAVAGWNVSPTLAGCDYGEDPCVPPECPCPEPPCPAVSEGTGIQAQASPASEIEREAMCENPEGSSSWTPEDWATYLGLFVNACDLDTQTTYEYVREGECYVLVENASEIEGGGIVVSWSGGPVDLTQVGAYTLVATLSNYPVEYEPCPDPPEVPKWVYESTTVDFEITVAGTQAPECCVLTKWMSDN